MRASSILQSPDSDLFHVNCVGEIDLCDPEMKIRFQTRCRFQTMGQQLFVGVLDACRPWDQDHHHGFGISIDTEDGTVTDMINGLGVIEYIDGAPLVPGWDLNIEVIVERQNRVLIAEIRVGKESFLHPALYLDGVQRLGAFVGTTLLWGGSANFHTTSLSLEAAGHGALVS